VTHGHVRPIRASKVAAQITAFAAETFGTPHVGVTLIRRGGRRCESAGATDGLVRRADELQNQLREGPCVEAATQSRTLFSNDVSSDPRWPRWGPRTAVLGLFSVLSSEVHAGVRRVGALNIYGDSTHEFTREDLETVQVLAGHVGVALRVAEKLEGLSIALDSRTVIGQAQGVLMNQYRIDANRAFAILSRLSQDENVRLILVAQRIVDDAPCAEGDVPPVAGVSGSLR
jgi:GAF domain-containing protein